MIHTVMDDSEIVILVVSMSVAVLSLVDPLVHHSPVALDQVQSAGALQSSRHLVPWRFSAWPASLVVADVEPDQLILTPTSVGTPELLLKA